MKHSPFHSQDAIRARFSQLLSNMYRAEVPQYGELLDLVVRTNAAVCETHPTLAFDGENDRLAVERHGAIRLGTPNELAVMRRLFAVMGMFPVSYYDLSSAGVPVHSTAFRPITPESLAANPFRVFTSLLRLDLITNATVRASAQTLLENRKIYTDRCIELIEHAEVDGGLTPEEADEFVREALETFRWHSDTAVDHDTYQRMRQYHPLVADVACFKGPHINHLTPRVLDIDLAQQGMVESGIKAKEWIEGPPARKCPILLRQTSFLALKENIRFIGGNDVDGTHTARFGEVEQRGYALTRKGRILYDTLLSKAIADEKAGSSRSQAQQAAFALFPDEMAILFSKRLIHVRYAVNLTHCEVDMPPLFADIDVLVAGGWVDAIPQLYEDFLPVSAAGIFHSNLGETKQGDHMSSSDQDAFEDALGCEVFDEFSLYEHIEEISYRKVMDAIHKIQETHLV